MRATVLALAALLVLPASAGAQQAWVKDYQDGVELFEKGSNDALAEQKLVQARDHRRAPKQSRRANFSGLFQEPFIPDYYLGLIAARRGEYTKAERLLQGALDAKLVVPGDKKEYAAATSTLQRVRDEQSRLASTTKPTPDPRPQPPPTPVNPPTQTTVTPPVVRPTPNPTPPPAEPTWLPGFRRSMDAARMSLGNGQFAEARGSLSAARSVAGDTTSRQAADTLGLQIDAAQNAEELRVVERARTAIRRNDVDGALTQVAALEALEPAHVALPELRTGVDRIRGALKGMADLARVERLGVKLFLSGNYKQSAAELERAVGAGVKSPRIYLFLASSTAALALLAPESDRPALVAQARKTYELAKPGAGALATDRRFISPSILQLLTGS